MGTVYRTQSQGYENPTYQAHSRLWETASLSYPDTWVRKTDYLHLPYTLPGAFDSFLDGNGGIKVIDGIKFTNQLTLRWGDYPGLSDGSSVITVVFIK